MKNRMRGNGGTVEPESRGYAADRGSRWELWLLTASIALALTVRLAFLGSKSLWLDEIWSLEISRMPWRSFGWIVLNMDPNASLYYILLHLWMGFGQSEFTLRLMSVLFSVAALVPLYCIGNHLVGKPTGLIATLLLAINAFNVQWSQEARTYGLVVLLVTVSSLFFVRSIEQPSLKTWAVYVATSVLAAYAHIFALLVLAAHFSSLIFLKRKEIPWKGVLTSMSAIGVLVLPLMRLTVERSRSPLVPLDWIPRLSFRRVYDLFCSLAGKPEIDSAHMGMVLLLLCTITGIAALRLMAESWRKKGRSFSTWRMGIVFCWLFIPIILVLMVSVVQPMLVNRYLLICSPAAALLTATGVRKLGSARSGSILLLLIVFLQLCRFPQYYRFRADSQQWRSAVKYVLGESRAGDAAMFCVAPGRSLFDYYVERIAHNSRNLPAIMYPDVEDEGSDTRAIAYLPPISEVLLNRALENHDRMWVVLYHDDWPATRLVKQRIETRFSQAYATTQEREFSGVHVILYSNPIKPKALAERGIGSVRLN